MTRPAGRFGRAWVIGLAIGCGRGLAAAERPIEVVGTVYEAGPGPPLPYATVQAVGTGRATNTNAEGRYRILVEPHQRLLKFSHIAYHPKEEPLPEGDSVIVLDVYLEPTVIEGDSLVVTARAQGPGRRIIALAIRRKQDILARVKDYSYDAYAKLIITDADDPDSESIWMLTETQSTSYWQRPARYKEVITARRQTANLDAADNLVTVGELLNFNRERIDMGAYSVVSPLARDALDHYDYYLLDTVQIDSRPAFRLEMEPKNPDEPRFVGYLYIADSTYDILDIDVGPSRGMRFPMVSQLRYRLHYARFQDAYWLPVEVSFSGRAELPFKVAGIPRNLGFEQFASVSHYRLDSGLSSSIFGDVQIEVLPGADDFDSTAWYLRQSIPLTREEEEAYRRIDSLEHVPTSLGTRLLQATAASTALMLGADDDFFRFNRVEDVYLGAAGSPIWRAFDLRLALGYSFGTSRVEHAVGVDYRLDVNRRMMVGFDYRFQTVARPSLSTSSRYNPSTLALLSQWDPFNYYGTQELELHGSIKPFNFGQLSLFYRDEAHRSLPVSTDYRMFDRDRPVRDNPQVAEGSLRSLEARLVYDDRPMYRQEGKDVRMEATQYTRIAMGFECASPDLIDNDFDFTRTYAQLFRRQQTLGLGLTTLNLYAGTSGGTLPPQRYFAVDYGKGIFFNRGGYQTLDEQTFGGRRALSATAYHNFRKLLFTRTGWPPLEKIPFWLSIHGGILWADMTNLTPTAGDQPALSSDYAYYELGFGLENLLPFLEPANVSLHFTWQLSSYDTRDFVALFALRL